MRRGELTPVGGPEAVPAHAAASAVSTLPLPPATLPAARPASGGVERPPLEAVHLYAAAYADLVAGRRLSALRRIEEAAAIDPDSAAVQKLLAQTLLESASPTAAGFGLLGGRPGPGEAAVQRAEAALERAAALQPDDLDTWYRLGRLRTGRGDFVGAIAALHTATATSDYRDDRARAALVDLYLARALDRAGRLDAAILSYRRVLAFVSELTSGRLQLPRDATELRLLMQRDDLLYAEVGSACERAGRWNDAAELYGLAATRPTATAEMHARWARALQKAGRPDEAFAVAVRQVAATEGDPGAIDLLLELAPSAHAAVRELRALADAAPRDLSLQRGVIEALRRGGHAELAYRQAVRALTPSVAEGAADRGLLRITLTLGRELGRSEEAARLLVAAMTRCRRADPTVTAEAIRHLTAPHLPGRLTLSRLQRLVVSADEVSARDFLLATAAVKLGRTELARTALARAADTFRPALLAWAADLADRQDLSRTAYQRQRERLLRAAAAHGDDRLVAWLDVWTRRDDPGDADAAYRRRLVLFAADGVPDDPWSALAVAEALRRGGDARRLDAHLARIAAEFPDHAAVQIAAISHLLGTGRLQLAEQRLNTWRSLQPDDPDVLAVAIAMALDVRRDPTLAVRLAEDALTAAASSRLLVTLQRAFTAAHRRDEFSEQLARRVRQQPAAMDLVLWHMADLAESDQAEALDALIAAAARAAADDPDLLYLLASGAYIYGRQDAADRLLERVLTLDDAHAAAANDLAYHLAERPSLDAAELERALTLATLATDSEPDVAAYLDTRGWVHYRRGEYELALFWLEQAAERTEPVDPEVADHLGDTLFRLSRLDEARQWWQRAAEAVREDDRPHRLRLLDRVRTKLAAGSTPPVAPSLLHPQAD